ncbi:disulfide bond formation protein B [Pelagibacterium lentulum]|uniref:Disulfide bond formation protein DsbB n=1 Tax=Pelagibacterium lentulum TaxID=2029865 RepID=A0A916VU67_9HYPH|nr:disulfide bond formation protein B [Pelagibacterium lentulum]GGA35400.1 disulfide bond formation protein DsbB [Pelagibacterium lentulum]
MANPAPLTVGPNRNRINAAFTLGLFAILGALAFEHIGGLYPCPLCLEQRWPYYVGLPALALLIFGWEKLNQHVRVGISVGVAGLFAWGTWLGVYHSGVEWGIFEGPQSCVGIGDVAVSMDMLGDLGGVRIIPCDAVQFELFGISLAGFNAIVSATIVVLLVMSIWGQVSRKA